MDDQALCSAATERFDAIMVADAMSVGVSLDSHKSKVFYFAVIRNCCFLCAAYFGTTLAIRISEKAVFVTINQRRTIRNHHTDTRSSA